MFNTSICSDFDLLFEELLWNYSLCNALDYFSRYVKTICNRELIVAFGPSHKLDILQYILNGKITQCPHY